MKNLLRFFRCFVTGCSEGLSYQYRGKKWRVVCKNCRRVGPWMES